jgi:hypothetical protein
VVDCLPRKLRALSSNSCANKIKIKRNKLLLLYYLALEQAESVTVWTSPGINCFEIALLPVVIFKQLHGKIVTVFWSFLGVPMPAGKVDIHRGK